MRRAGRLPPDVGSAARLARLTPHAIKSTEVEEAPLPSIVISWEERGWQTEPVRLAVSPRPTTAANDTQLSCFGYSSRARTSTAPKERFPALDRYPFPRPTA